MRRWLAGLGVLFLASVILWLVTGSPYVAAWVTAALLAGRLVSWAARRRSTGGIRLTVQLVAASVLTGACLALLMFFARRSQPLANGIERLRGDGIKFIVPAGCIVTMDGLALADGQRLEARSRWLDGALKPSVARVSGWAPWTTLRVSADCSDGVHDRLSIQFDPDAPVRILRLATLDVWQSPVGAPGHAIIGWLVPDGSIVRAGQSLAKLAGGGTLTAPQAGRLHALTFGGALLETREPPVGKRAAAEPKNERRLVLDRWPSAHAVTLVTFLLLGALLLASAWARTSLSKASPETS